MRVSLAEMQQYAKTLTNLSDVAAERAISAISPWMTMHPEATVAECREFAIMAVRDAVTKYGDAAAVHAAKLYDEIMAAEGVDVPAASIYGGPDIAALEGNVRRQAGKLKGETSDVNGFLGQLENLTRDLTRQAASETVMDNVERASKTKKGKEVRFARVPQKANPCGYCVMLASRGFVYVSKATAEAANHHNCTCLVMPGIDGKTKIDGYDPDGMYDRYLSCRETIEHSLSQDWSLLSLAERSEYRGGFNGFCKNRIAGEMNTRNRVWLKTGIADPPTLLEGAEVDEWEAATADILWENGLVPTFRPRSRVYHDRQADTSIGGDLWEFKSPSGKTKMVVHNAIKSDLYGNDKHLINPQSSHLIVSNVRSDFSADELIVMAKKTLNGETGLTAAELAEIDEILIVDRETRNVFRVRNIKNEP